MDGIDRNTEEFLSQVVASFSPGLQYACAYGSGVFKQSGHQSVKDNMIDLIFVVDNAVTWHQRNVQRFSNHYSFLKYFSPNTLATLQTQYGATIYYNTRIMFNDRLIKYGVIESNDFLNDLNTWESLYVAGRLHKPVHVIKGLNDATILDAVNTNLNFAVKTALLLSPEKTSYKEFYMLIASLSYTGDFRMVVGEDKRKIKNIVEPNMEKFHLLYRPIMKSDENIHLGSKMIEQNISNKIQVNYIQQLPLKLRNIVMPSQTKEINAVDISLRLLNNRTYMQQQILQGVSSIVKSSSTSQSLKGILTAGLSKTIIYSGDKLKKMLKGVVR